MMSQLILGYMIGIVTGALYKQYALTMGLFVFFMGLGALAFKTTPRPLRWIVTIQLACPLFVGAVWLISKAAFASGFDWGWYGVQIAIVSLIGFLSGAELPLLDRMAQDDSESTGIDHLLFYDYLAMSFATFLFAALAFPALGVLGCFALILVGHGLTLGLLGHVARSTL